MSTSQTLVSNVVLIPIDFQVAYHCEGAGQLNLTKPQLNAYFTNMIEACKDLNMTTVSINGHKNCTSWEWNITFNYVKKMEEVANDKELGNLEVGGGLLKMVGVSVTWWDEDDKIIKNHDYAKLVENFEGR